MSDTADMVDRVAYIEVDGERLPVTIETVRVDLTQVDMAAINQMLGPDPFED